MQPTNYLTNQVYHSFKAGWQVRVLFEFTFENGDKEYGSFNCRSIGSRRTIKDKKNFSVSLSKMKAKYGTCYTQDDGGAFGYNDIKELASWY